MKKLFPLILLMVLLTITVNPVLAAGPPEANQLQPGDLKIPPAKDAVLSVDETINVDILGHRHIQKWQRVIDGIIEVKNDYIRKDVDLDTNKTILYDKQWRDIELESVEIKPFEPPSGEYYWKKVVLFVDEEDLGFFEDGSSFYTFFDADEYPLVCWEVRYTDGTTVMYDLDGNLIGYGVPAPSDYGYLFSGYDCNWWCKYFGLSCDIWSQYRDNANYWYSEWIDYTWSVFDPTTSQIRDWVEWPLIKFYYAIAHGGSTECSAKRCNGNYPYYRANDDEAYADMENRDPMVFAFLGHCNAMNDIDYPSFSDAFRKGLSGYGSDTFTVGYTNMGGSPAWEVSFSWQNQMFIYMNDGWTIYYAWLYATYVDYPQIIGYVAWAGDPYLTVN
jgi:hypothetical protein